MGTVAPGRDPRTIEVVAHRGASDDVAEHTLAAYLLAIGEGADGLESDVRLTRDGHLVCVHDRRVDRTSDGTGVVSTLELADLAELDFGRWRHGDEMPDRDHHEIVTLDRLLAVIADCGRRVELAIETKHPTRYAGLVERTLVDLLHRYGWAHPRLGASSPVRVMSFSPLSLRRIRALAPSIGTVLLMERVPLRLRDGSLPRTADIAGPSIAILRAHPRYAERVQRAGGRVHVWTVDDPGDVQLCIGSGVDAIITNRPRRVLDALGR